MHKFEKTYIYICNFGCESENISIEPKQIKRDGDGIVLTLEWSNERDNNYNLGKPFKMFRYMGDGEPEELSYIGASSDPNDPVYPVREAVGYIVWKKSKSGMDYNITDYYDISLPGKYRFEAHGAWVEFQIIEYFFSNAGKALSRNDILKQVWGESYFGDEKVVDVNIRRLRMKIEDEPSIPKHLVTVWGMGYKWL